MKNKAVIRFSKFKPDSQGHGGHKRTAQLFELFKKAHVHVIDFEKSAKKIHFSDKLKYFLKALKIIIKFNRFFGLISAYKEAKVIGHDFYSLEKLLLKSKSIYAINTFVWEYTWSPNWYMPLIAKQLGLKTIAAPHNIESLVFTQKSHKPKKVLSPLWLDEEIEYLNYANKIFCISREEQWLLSLKINPNKVHYLPYYPPKSTLDVLSKIREERIKIKQKNTVTILGSAVNPPTLKGMLDLKKYLKNNNNLNVIYDFVGYGVKWVKEEDEILPKNFIISESVSNDKLHKKLLNTSCVLINQMPSSGALTKIQEILIAGIPVIVNSMGARSYFNIEGVYVFERLSDLDQYLKHLDTLTLPKMPKADGDLEMTFTHQFVN